MLKNKFVRSFWSMLLGAAFAVIFETLYQNLSGSRLVPIWFAGYAGIFFLIIYVAFSIAGTFRIDSVDQKNASNLKDSIKLSAVLVAALILLTILFEFLYELGGNKIQQPDSYVFLIDDSGSMEENDPGLMRSRAVRDIMETAGSLPYALYRFSDRPTLLKSMGPYRSGDEMQYEFCSDGGTDIIGSAERILDDISQKKSTRLLVLSDGQSSSWGMRSLVNECRRRNITICTVGFGSCDEKLMSKLASQTGGVFVMCTNVDQLTNFMQEAITNNADRNLLSERYLPSRDGLYGFLRILFLTILGAVWSFAKANLTDHANRISFEKQLGVYFTLCFVGTLSAEFLNRIGLSMFAVRILFWALWAFQMYVGEPIRNQPSQPLPGLTTPSSVAPVQNSSGTAGNSGTNNLYDPFKSAGQNGLSTVTNNTDGKTSEYSTISSGDIFKNNKSR